jgi:ABC-type antimicrobial peptide transport system permease subunit
MRPRVVMRVAGDPMQYEKSVQAVVAGIDPFLFLQAPASMEEQIGLATGSQRFETTLVGSFAAIALFLVGLGLYATLATMVATRTREIGLRLAIGAGRRNIAALILARGASLVLFGLLAGSMIALAASRLMISSTWLHPLLYRVTWFEPQVYFAILLSLGGVAMGACLLPTWRAVRVDPMRVLRDE